MRIQPFKIWLAMMFVILAWPDQSNSTHLKFTQNQNNQNFSQPTQNNKNHEIKLNNSDVVQRKTEPRYDVINKEINSNELNESKKQNNTNFLTFYDYNNKIVQERNINFNNINNEANVSKKEENESDFNGLGLDKFMNLAVGGNPNANNITLSTSKRNVNKNEDLLYELSNDKSSNQRSGMETYVSSTLNNNVPNKSTNFYDINKEEILFGFDKKENNLNNKNFNKKARNLKYDQNFYESNIFNKPGANNFNNDNTMTVQKREIDNALDYGLKYVEDLVNNREPLLYKLGFVLHESHPASKVANFGRPKSEKAMLISKFGYALLEASRMVAESYPENVSRSRAGFPDSLQSRVALDQCPLRGRPRCLPPSRRFRTADGVCNNFENPWRGTSMLPMQRFLPPVYEDGIQSIRRSILGPALPSPRDVSTIIHRDKNIEIDSVTLMFAQWGQFLDHDIVSAVKHLSFNGSTPRCCDEDGRGFLPLQFLHPACLPIEVPRNDPFLSQFGIRCMEFTRSSPSTRIDCDLGWREQINQVTPYIDASMIYGSDVDTMDAMRTFRNGKIVYGRPQDQGPLNPPDPVDSELCRAGVITEECMQPGDTRFSEQPGLIAIHTVFVRYHNKIATVLSKLNPHWSDERTFQETRKIVYSAIQHITYREFLPIVLGPQVMELFELKLLGKGYYTEYDPKINPAVANAFGAAAFRFGHSMVQNSFIRTDSKHFPLGNNVSLHEEDSNPENIWSFGAVDRLLLGFSNQPSQRRDEFIASELTNHLFQFSGHFGMDLAAINIQRGRDHGIPPYTFWRIPCGLSPIKTWDDLEKVMSFNVVRRLKSLYMHVDDIDLFTGGLSEKPLKGGVVGPTFACIIAQQFVNLRRGDRFWYENGNFDSSFTPAQLKQIRRISFAQILCQTMNEIETIQPFVFLSPDNFKNSRIVCNGPDIRNFDLSVWAEKSSNFESNELLLDGPIRSKRSPKPKKKPNITTTTKKTPHNTNPTKIKTNAAPTNSGKLNIKLTNLTVKEQPAQTKYFQQTNLRPVQYYQVQDADHNDVTYLVGLIRDRTTAKPQIAPVEVNIKIQYFAPTTTTTQKTVVIKKKPNTSYFVTTTKRPQIFYDSISAVTKKPTSKRPNIVTYFDQDRPTKRPHIVTPDYGYSTTSSNNYYNSRPTYNDYNRPSNRPTNTYDTDYYDNDDSVVVSDTYSNRRPAINSAYDTNKKRPYESYNTYSENIRPTSTNNYNFVNSRPDTNSYEYKPTYEEIITYYQNKRPTVHNPYNRDRIDNTDDIQEQFFNNQLTKKPIFGQTNFSIPNRIYSSTTPRVQLTHISDKLDFKSRYMDEDIPTDIRTDKTDEDKFVKIGTVHGEINVHKIKRHARGSNGNESFLPEDETKSKYYKKRVRILDLEDFARNLGSQWENVDETSDSRENLYDDSMPYFVNKSVFSEEVPRPMVDLSSDGESGYVTDRQRRRQGDK